MLKFLKLNCFSYLLKYITPLIIYPYYYKNIESTEWVIFSFYISIYSISLILFDYGNSLIGINYVKNNTKTNQQKYIIFNLYYRIILSVILVLVCCVINYKVDYIILLLASCLSYDHFSWYLKGIARFKLVLLIESTEFIRI